jgi:hypothetical protein
MERLRLLLPNIRKDGAAAPRVRGSLQGGKNVSLAFHPGPYLP